MKTTHISFCLLGILGIGTFAMTPAFVRLAPRRWSAAPEDAARIARSRIAGVAARYSAAEAKDIAASRETIAGIINAARGQVSGKAAAATLPFRGLQNAAGCAAMGAKDKLSGGHELQGHIRRSLEPATGLLKSTRDKVLIEIATSRQNSLARANNYRKETLQFAETAGIDLAALRIKQSGVGEMAKAVDAAIAATISAEIGASLELLFIKPTMNILLRTLGPAIASAAGTLGAAGTACVADGPLPVGDIIGCVIALGGTAWTAHDIWKAVDENNRLPGKIEALLRQQLDALDETSARVLDQLEEGYRPLFALSS